MIKAVIVLFVLFIICLAYMVIAVMKNQDDDDYLGY
jgi:hypothetical protein